MKITDVRPQAFVKSLRCDRCGREAELDSVESEFYEFTSISNKAGYGSIFGDGSEVEIDLCQHCLKETLGSWLRVKSSSDRYEGFDPSKHGGGFPSSD